MFSPVRIGSGTPILCTFPTFQPRPQLRSVHSATPPCDVMMTSLQTLVQCIKPFGTLTNAMVVPVDKRSQGEGEEEEGEGGGDDYTIAYVR